MGLFFKSAKEKRLIALQNLVMGNTSSKRLELSVKQILYSANLYVQQRVRIATDCERIVNTTEKPDIFYERMALLQKCIDELMKIEQIDPNLFKPTRPSELSRKYAAQYEHTELQMWRRCFGSYADKAGAMKTEKGRANKYQAFFDLAEKYMPMMTNAAKNAISNFRRGVPS